MGWREEEGAARAELEARELQLSQAVKLAQIGIFDHDLLTNAYRWSPELYEIHGLPPEQPATLDAIVRHIHPDDRDAHVAAVRAAHDPSGDGIFAREYRILRPDGSVRWLSVRSQTTFAGEGPARRAIRVLGVERDITEERTREDELRRAHERTRIQAELLVRAEQAARVAAFYHRVSEPRTLVWSDKMYDLLGLDRDEPPTQAATMMPFPPAVRALLARALAEATPSTPPLEIELPLLPAPGRAEWVRLYAVPRFEGGRFVERSGALQDITDRKRLEMDIANVASSERERIAADLHDDLGQVLTQLTYQLRTLARDVAEGETSGVAPAITTMLGAVHRAEESCRRIAHSYVAPVSADTLLPMLGALVSEVPPPFRARLAGTEAVPPWVTPIAAQELYRISQEAVRNAVKHSRGRTLTIELEVAAELLDLSITDDGVGLPAEPSGGVGLLIMRSRAARIGALLQFEAQAGGGTSVRVTLAAQG